MHQSWFTLCEIYFFLIQKFLFIKNTEFYSVTEYKLDPLQSGNKCGPLTVNVLPVNEWTPVFEPSIQNVTLPENTPQSKFFLINKQLILILIFLFIIILRESDSALLMIIICLL